MLKEFTYLKPKSKKELFNILSESSKKTKVLAGGTDILADMRGDLISPTVLVDLKKIKEYQKIEFSIKKGLTVGAAVTMYDLISNNIVRKKYPLLVEAASQVASPQLRNRATIVGNVCTASPCTDMGRALLCLDSSLVISSLEGTKTVKLKDFFVSVKKTILKPNEIVEKIIVPADMSGLKGGNLKLKRIKGHDLALASVSAVRKDNKFIISLGSCHITPVVFEVSVKESVSSICKKVDKLIKPIDDLRASKDYRIFMVKKYIERIIKRLKD